MTIKACFLCLKAIVDLPNAMVLQAMIAMNEGSINMILCCSVCSAAVMTCFTVRSPASLNGSKVSPAWGCLLTHA